MGLKRNLILVRHGQSEWNEKNLFTGWKDPGLTPLGYEEARNAGKLIMNTRISFDCMFTSALKRAQLTGDLILNEIQQTEMCANPWACTFSTIRCQRQKQNKWTGKGRSRARTGQFHSWT